MLVAPLPGHPRGIQGVVVHEGEFLPVLAWEDLPGGVAPSSHPQALVVLRSRLGILIEKLFGTLEVDPTTCLDPELEEPWRPWLGAMVRSEGKDLPLLDADRLVALLRAFRSDR